MPYILKFSMRINSFIDFLYSIIEEWSKVQKLGREITSKDRISKSEHYCFWMSPTSP